MGKEKEGKIDQIVQMLEESNTRMKKIMKGDYNHDQIADAQREFEIQIRAINATLKMTAKPNGHKLSEQLKDPKFRKEYIKKSDPTRK